MPCVKCNKSLDGRIKRASCYVVKINSTEILVNSQKLAEFEHKSVKPLANDALLKESLQLLMKKLNRSICVLLDGKALADEQKRLIDIVKNRCRTRINKRQISVNIRQVNPAVELLKISRKQLLRLNRAFTLRPCNLLLDEVGKLDGIAANFICRRYHHGIG